MKIPPGTEVVVTGASRGIGLGIARVFAQQGASTVLVGRDATTLARSRDGLPTPHRDTAGQCHRVWAMSVARAEDWRGLFASLTRPGVLINAAGVTHYSLLPRTSIGTIDEVISVNLAGAIYGSREASKAMLKTGGVIINVSSALAHRGGSGSSVYAASKAGLIGFTKALAEELGPRGVRCNAIAPGFIETDMIAGMSKEMRQKTIDRTGVRRIGTVEEVAQAALFLVENEFMNGTTITIDGGLTYE